MKKQIIIAVLFILIIIVGISYLVVTNNDANISQWSLTPIPCSERATPTYTPVGKHVDCESSSDCKLNKTSSCPTCQDIIYKCV